MGFHVLGPFALPEVPGFSPFAPNSMQHLDIRLVCANDVVSTSLYWSLGLFDWSGLSRGCSCYPGRSPDIGLSTIVVLHDMQVILLLRPFGHLFGFWVWSLYPARTDQLPRITTEKFSRWPLDPGGGTAGLVLLALRSETLESSRAILHLVKLHYSLLCIWTLGLHLATALALVNSVPRRYHSICPREP